MKIMKVFMRAVLCGVLPLCLLCGSLSVAAYTGSAPQTKTAGANLRVMSYNVLVDNDESLGGWSWGKPLDNRGNLASACIDYYQPDVIGFQECNYKWHVSLKDNLKDYAFVNADVPEVQPLEKAESLGKKDWMCTTMMYNKKTLKLIKNELVGYSVNYWGCIQRMRYASMAVFEIKATGERFTFFSTHLDAEQDAKGQQMRQTQSNELAACIKRYKETYGYPVIGTGDFNSKFEDAPLQNVASKAGMTASTNNRGGIDYILYSAGIQSKYFTVVSDADVMPASDHKPIFADLKVEKYAFPTSKATEATKPTRPTAVPTEGDYNAAVVVTKPTQAEKTKAPTAQTGGVENPVATTPVTESTQPEEGQPTDAGATEATQAPTDTQESLPTQATQSTGETIGVAGESDEGLSGPVLALIAFGGVLVLLGTGIGLYLLLNKNKK